MHLAALTAGLVTVNTVSAFLIPPETRLPDFQNAKEEDRSGIATVFGADTEWHVELECPGCPWAGVEEVNGTQVQWSREYETSLQLSISADPSNGLLINNVATFIPHRNNPTPQSLPLLASQKRVNTGATSSPLPIDFILERMEPLPSPTDSRRFLLPIKFTIVGFASRPVHVDTLSIDLLSTSSPQTLSVLRIQKVPFASTPGANSCADDDITWSLCRMRAIVMHRVIETLRSMRERAHRAKGWVRVWHGCHHDRANAHSSHRGHRAHRWAKMLHSTLRFLVIPALLGVIGGLLASAVGMLVGQFIVFSWLRLARRRRRSPSGRSGVVVVAADEKRGLLDADADGVTEEEGQDEETLPRYGENAPPQYQDVEAHPGDDRP